MMKRLGLLLATAILFVAASVNAQGVKDTSYKTGGGNVIKVKHGESRIYGEVTSFTVNARTTVKVSFNCLIEKISGGKEAFKTCVNLENYQYESLVEALNILASHGWNVEHVWTEDSRTGVDTHFLISKSVDKLIPANPWMDKSKGAKGGSAKGGSSRGR